jgi:signal peptidase II
VAEAPASPEPRTSPESRPQRRRRWALFLGLAGAVVLLDQATKLWVDASFEVASRAIPAGQPGGPTELIGEYLRIAKTYNDGAIFGVFEAIAPIMAVLSLLVIVGITWFEWRHGAAAGMLVAVGLGLLLGGAIGNLIDRLAVGYVLDFVDVYWRDLHFWAFNVADSAITVGVGVMILDMMRLGSDASTTA